MPRIILIALLVLYLIVVGLFPAAAAPVAAALAGAAFLIGLIPGPVWAVAAGAAWWRHHRTSPGRPASA